MGTSEPNRYSSARGSASSFSAQCAIWASAEPGGGDPVDERGQRAAVRAAALRAADLRQPLPGDDGAAGLGAPREHAHHDPAAERVTAEVVLAGAEPEVLDEGEPVVGEHVGRISGRIVRSRALPVTAQVGQDEAESRSTSASPGPWSSQCDPVPIKPCSRISGRPEPISR